MNVLLINGSPNAKGCTFTALNEMATTLQKEGFDTEIIHVGNRDIRGCIACGRCSETGHCVFDDLVNEVAPKLEAADGLVVGSPVYYASANGTLTNFLDRLFFSTPFSKRMKVGAAVCSARRGGTTATFDQLNKYFTISEMPVGDGRCRRAAERAHRGPQHGIPDACHSRRARPQRPAGTRREGVYQFHSLKHVQNIIPATCTVYNIKLPPAHATAKDD